MRNNRGFTLVELMVTLAVLAIIAMMAVPFFGDMMLRQNLNKSQGELFAALNKAKSQALNKKRSVTVRLNVDLADTEDQVNWMPSGRAELTATSPRTIVFDLNGMANVNADTTLSICIEHSGTKSKNVNVSRVGLVELASDGSC